MLLARLANKVAKPNGQYYVTDERVVDFIARQKVKDLPGKMIILFFLTELLYI